MFNYMGDNSPTDLNPPDVYNPNDPTSKFYCDSVGVDDPACYAPGGYYGPGGAGYQPQQSGSTDPAGGTYTLPVQVFNTTGPPILVGRPEATPMPLPPTLEFPPLATPPATSYAPLIVGAIVIALLVMSGKKGK